MYIRFLPSEYVLRYKRGRLYREGAGLSFFCAERNTAVCSIPVSNIDSDFIFSEMTRDFQTVTVQGQLTFRIVDYKAAAAAVDFTVNVKTKKYNDTPIDKLSKRMINLSEVVVKDKLAGLDMKQALQSSSQLAEAVFGELSGSSEPGVLGVEVIGFSVLKISANAETTKALESTAREEILRKADDALYERRNASIEQERRVKENELNTDISVEEKKKKIKESEIATKRMLLEKENEFASLKIESEVRRENFRLDSEIELEEKRRKLSELKLENSKRKADAEAYRIRAIMEAFNALDKDSLVALATLNLAPEQMMAQAFEKLAGSSSRIGTLNISPDLLESIRSKK